MAESPDEGEWISSSKAAAMLRTTAGHFVKRARALGITSTEREGRVWWCRADILAVIARIDEEVKAREARARAEWERRAQGIEADVKAREARARAALERRVRGIDEEVKARDVRARAELERLARPAQPLPPVPEKGAE